MDFSQRGNNLSGFGAVPRMHHRTLDGVKDRIHSNHSSYNSYSEEEDEDEIDVMSDDSRSAAFPGNLHLAHNHNVRQSPSVSLQ